GSACACRRTRHRRRSSASSGNSGNGIGVFHQIREVFFRISFSSFPPSATSEATGVEKISEEAPEESQEVSGTSQQKECHDTYTNNLRNEKLMVEDFFQSAADSCAYIKKMGTMSISVQECKKNQIDSKEKKLLELDKKIEESSRNCLD
ncbi:hypothetical protein AAFN46_20535, partial [Pseudomonas sp. CAU 1711]|uniref:hypothetical protein n=1 Tax=Pseudomonas sp. CAU 1711 TaxID=3140356 RepID=UPI00326046CC